MKEVLKIIGIYSGIVLGIISAVLAACFGAYLFLGFVLWIFSDPLNLIADIPLNSTQKAVLKCEQTGGIARTDGWGVYEKCVSTEITK